MGRPRKEFGISKGGYNGSLLIVFRDADDAIKKINAKTTSRAIAKKNAPRLIRDFLQEQEEKKQLQDTEDRSKTQATTTVSEISPDWTMSQLDAYWWEHMGGTLKETTRLHVRSAFRNWTSLMGTTLIKDVDYPLVVRWHTAFLERYNRERRFGTPKTDKSTGEVVRDAVTGETVMMKPPNPDHVDVKTSNGLRNYHGDLQSVWSTLVQGGIVDQNPFAGSKPKNVELDPRGRAWGKEKYKTILKAAEKFAEEGDSKFAHFMPYVIRFLANTGMRPKEFVNLKASDIKEDEHGIVCAFIRSSSAKSGKPRKVPLNPDAQKALEGIQILSMERKHDYRNLIKNAKRISTKDTRVGLSAKKSLEHSNRKHREELWMSVAWTDKDYNMMIDPPKRVRIDTLGDVFATIRDRYLNGMDCVLYDCRHTYIVNYLDSGGNITKLASIVGHSDIKLTQRYARTDNLPALDLHLEENWN